MIDLLSKLEEQFPVKRGLKIEGWPDGFFMWRLDSDAIIELHQMPHSTPVETAFYSVRLCQLSIGDENGPGVFDNDRGHVWLSKNPIAMTTLAKAVREFNELTGPSEERKKKSETIDSSDCSNSPENLDTDTHGI